MNVKLEKLRYMNRKLTEKEVTFLSELSSLMLKHDAMLGTDNNRVCIYVGGHDDEEDPVVLPRVTTFFCDLDEFINLNT